LKLQYNEPLSNFAFKFNLRRYNKVGLVGILALMPADAANPGRAVHPDPMKPMLNRLELST
jgi:hypothetical protein